MVILLFMGLFIGYQVPMTQIHQDCLKGNKEACEVDKKHNLNLKLN